MLLVQVYQSVLDCVFPRLCLLCKKQLYKHEKDVCLVCWQQLPKIHLHELTQSPLLKVFQGRIALKAAIAWLSFNRLGTAQSLMHAIKYQGERSLAIELGYRFASDVSRSLKWMGIQALIPVPLHPKKMKQRGYNQAEAIAIGLSNFLKIPVFNQVLQVVQAKSTQTRKNRYDRWLNAQSVYELTQDALPSGIHCVALVDDVVTTGATIEACVQALKDNTEVQIVVLALCFPMN